MNERYQKEIICNQPCLFSSDHIQSEIIFLVIPGNPSIIEYYIEFSDQLISLFNYPVIIGSLHQENETRLSVEQAIHLKIELLNEFIRRYPTSKFIIFCHSIGNYITLHALRTINQEKILGFYGLFPALAYLQEAFCTMYKIVTSSSLAITTVSYMVNILKILPHDFTLKLLHKIADVPERYCDIIINYLDYPLLSQMLFLCKDEGKTIRDYTVDFIEYLNSLNTKLHLIYGQNDVYGNKDVGEDMKFRCPKAQIEIIDCLHAFVLGSVQQVIDVIEPMIKQDLLQFNTIQREE